MNTARLFRCTSSTSKKPPLITRQPGSWRYAIQYQQKSNSEKAQNLLKTIDMYDELMSGMNDFTVVNNTAQYHQSIFSAIYYQNGLMVTAENPEGAKNGCSDGVTYTEQQHQENRRTEFKIVSCPSCPRIEK